MFFFFFLKALRVCFISRQEKCIFLMCFITEHVNTVSQSELSPSSTWVLVDVRHAFCQFPYCCHRQDECIKTDFNVSKLHNAFVRLLPSVGMHWEEKTEISPYMKS